MRPSIRALEAGEEYPDPVKPNTIAKSIAIGNPADGFQVLRSVRSTGGSGAMVTDEEIVQGIQLLAETEGIFTEPAGGVTVAATRQLIERGRARPRRVDRDLHHRQRLQDRGGHATGGVRSRSASADRWRSSRRARRRRRRWRVVGIGQGEIVTHYRAPSSGAPPDVRATTRSGSRSITARAAAICCRSSTISTRCGIAARSRGCGSSTIATSGPRGRTVPGSGARRSGSAPTSATRTSCRWTKAAPTSSGPIATAARSASTICGSRCAATRTPAPSRISG